VDQSSRGENPAGQVKAFPVATLTTMRRETHVYHSL
jgi:hypothetical protein